MKVTHGTPAAGHGHGGKGGGVIPPRGDNNPAKGVARSKSGRTGHNTPHKCVGLPDSDDCAFSVRASHVFFAIDDGKSLSK